MVSPQDEVVDKLVEMDSDFDLTALLPTSKAAVVTNMEAVENPSVVRAPNPASVDSVSTVNADPSVRGAGRRRSSGRARRSSNSSQASSVTQDSSSAGQQQAVTGGSDQVSVMTDFSATPANLSAFLEFARRNSSELQSLLPLLEEALRNPTVKTSQSASESAGAPPGAPAAGV